MPVETVRLSERAKTQLITLKRRTGIQHWNVLCRWAFCLSLAEPSQPPNEHIRADSNVEMTWRTFSGVRDAEYTALLRQRCLRDGGNPADNEALTLCLHTHLHRGIAYLLHLNNISAFLQAAARSPPAEP